MPLPKGTYRFQGAIAEVAEYLDAVSSAERGFHLRARLWGYFAIFSAVAAVLSGVWAYGEDEVYRWGVVVACAALALLGYSRFRKAGVYDLPDDRLIFTRTLLRELLALGWTEVDLALNLCHRLDIEDPEDTSPDRPQLEMGEAAEEGEDIVVRQRWLMLDLGGDPSPRLAAADQLLIGPDRSRAGRGGRERRQTYLQLRVPGDRGREIPPTLQVLGECAVETGRGATTWTVDLPARELYWYVGSSSSSSSRRRVASEGRQAGAKEAERLAELISPA